MSEDFERVVMAIDPSLTGFAIVIIGDTGVIFYKEMSTKPAKTLKSRFARYQKLVDFAKEANTTYQPDIILIEGYSYGSKGRSVISLGELGGVLRETLLSDANLPQFVEVPPTTLKKFITGKGNASKIVVATSLAKRYNMAFESDNHADAYGLARMGRCVIGAEKCETKAQQEAVDVVLKTLGEG